MGMSVCVCVSVFACESIFITFCHDYNRYFGIIYIYIYMVYIYIYMQVIGVCLCVFVCKSLLTTLDHKIITVIFDFIIYI